jgi:hypothetical protein
MTKIVGMAASSLMDWRVARLHRGKGATRITVADRECDTALGRHYDGWRQTGEHPVDVQRKRVSGAG